MTLLEPWPVRVYYEDTDAVGVVYYARYLQFAERARTEMLRAGGLDATQLRMAHDLAFVVSEVAVKFISPARLDDLLHIHTNLVSIKKVQCRLRQRIFKDDQCLVDMHVRLAMIDKDGRPKPLPQDVLAFFHNLPNET